MDDEALALQAVLLNVRRGAEEEDVDSSDDGNSLDDSGEVQRW